MNTIKLELEAKDVLKKDVKGGTSSARIFVPKDWEGSEVVVAKVESGVFEKLEGDLENGKD